MRYIVEAEQEFRVRKVHNGFILTHETKVPKDDGDYNWETTNYVFQSAEEALAKGIELLKGIING